MCDRLLFGGWSGGYGVILLAEHILFLTSYLIKEEKETLRK